MTDESGHTLNSAAESERDTVCGSLNVLAREEQDWERVCVSVCQWRWEKERARYLELVWIMQVAECRVLADRVPFSLICLWFIFHSNFAMCFFKHTENRKPRAVELACSCQIKSSLYQRRSDTKWEKLMNALIARCFKITSQTAARLYSQHYCFSLTAVS